MDDVSWTDLHKEQYLQNLYTVVWIFGICMSFAQLPALNKAQKLQYKKHANHKKPVTSTKVHDPLLRILGVATIVENKCCTKMAGKYFNYSN